MKLSKKELNNISYLDDSKVVLFSLEKITSEDNFEAMICYVLVVINTILLLHGDRMFQ